jgi:hypothetical protein
VPFFTSKSSAIAAFSSNSAARIGASLRRVNRCRRNAAMTRFA